MKNLKKVLAIALAVIMVFGLAACGGNGGDSSDLSKQTFKIGYFGNLPEAGDCLIQRNVIKLFIDKWNEEGTLYGAKVEYFEYDNTNNGVQDTEMSIKDANKLISQDEVDVVIPAQMSNIIQATGAIINDAEVLDIGLGLSATWMAQGWDYVYRTALNNDYSMPTVTSTMTSLNQKSCAILYENTDNCLGIRDSLKPLLKEANIEITAEEMLASAGGTGITGQITSVLNSNPDCIYIAAMGNNFGTVIKQLRQAGYKGMIYICQSLTTEELESVGAEEVNGVATFTMYFAYNSVDECTNEFQKSVLKAYEDKYGYCPASDMIFKTWDAMLLIENAVLEAKSLEPSEIQPVIKNLKFEGCGGTMDFTKGSNECYFGSRAWVYTDNTSTPTVLEDWLASDYAKSIKIVK